MNEVENAEGKEMILAGERMWVEAQWAGDMQDAIRRVRELHKPHLTNFSGIERLECSGCFTFESDDFGDEWTNYKPYPCDTILALDGDR